MTWLVSTVGIPTSQARIYQAQLNAEGFDTLEALQTLDRSDLEDYGMDEEHIGMVLHAIETKPQNQQPPQGSAGTDAGEGSDANQDVAVDHNTTIATPTNPMAWYAKALLGPSNGLPEMHAGWEDGESALAEMNAGLQENYPSISSSDVDEASMPPILGWLVGLGIPLVDASAYYVKFEEDGFDTMDAVAIIEAQDIADMGVKEDHAAVILQAILAIQK